MKQQIQKKDKFEDFIGIFENTLSPKLCETFVEWFEWCSTNRFTTGSTLTGKPTESDDGEASIMREDEALHFPGSSPADKTISSVYHRSLPYALCNDYYQNLQRCFLAYSQKYHIQYMNLQSYSFKIHKVKPGQGYHIWHYESASHDNQNRVLVFMTYLKVPEEGGETEFLHQSKRIKPVIGRTLIWPAHFTHFHRGLPPLQGEKYYITGWFESESDGT